MLVAATAELVRILKYADLPLPTEVLTRAWKLVLGVGLEIDEGGRQNGGFEAESPNSRPSFPDADDVVGAGLPIRFQHPAVDYVLLGRVRGHLRRSVEGDGGVIHSLVS